jgi:predicted lipoprotein with Yx(FWY)xxD motif
MKRSSLLPLASVPVLIAALAGCGSSGSATAASTGPPAAATAASGGKALKVRSTSLGRILVDTKGRTLYAFGHDLKNKSRCSGACASNWPPALAPKKPRVGAGVSKAKLRVIKRSGGARQLSYAGRPLYRFSGDSAAGDANGQGVTAFGGTWHVVAPSGKVIMGSGQSSSGGNTGGGYPSYPGGY